MSFPVIYTIAIRKDALKFAAAHMTVFSATEKEALHGHNYTVGLEIELEKRPLRELLSFAIFKAPARHLCDAWDEKVLLPEQCPFFQAKDRAAESVEFSLCGKRYLLPRDEVALLPVENVTTETLAELFCERYVAALLPAIAGRGVVSLRVRVEETPGQGASVQWVSPETRSQRPS